MVILTESDLTSFPYQQNEAFLQCRSSFRRHLSFTNTFICSFSLPSLFSRGVMPGDYVTSQERSSYAISLPFSPLSLSSFF
jgi:hypothetical protein